MASECLDEVVALKEDWIALAILRLAEPEKTVEEGAAETPLAALMASKLPGLRGRCTVLTICGGNTVPAVLSRVIVKGLVADECLCRFTGTISDRPGGLEALTKGIVAAGTRVRDIAHDRAFKGRR